MRLITISITCCISTIVQAQWKLVEYFPSGIDTIFSSDIVKIESSNSSIENIISSNKNNFLWTYDLKSSIYLNENLILLVEIDTPKINWIKILIHEQKKDWTIIDSISTRDDLLPFNVQKEIITTNYGKFIDKVALIIETKDISGIIRLNNLFWGQWKRLECYPPYLESILGEKKKNKNYAFPPDMIFRSTDSINNDNDEVKLLLKLTKIAIKYYNYYETNKLSKDSIQKAFDLFIDNTDKIDVWKFANKLNYFLRTTFHDGHFYLDLRDSKSFVKPYSPPLRCYWMNETIQIAAIFESINNIGRGDVVLSVNGKNTSYLLDSLENLEYGTKEHRRTRAVAKILNQSQYDTTELFIRQKKSEDTIYIKQKFDEKYSVPYNFYSKYCVGRYVNDSLYYYCINHWVENTYEEFLKSFDLFSKSKGIILDLRGNDGGSYRDMSKVLSLFIEHPVVAYNEIYSNGNKESFLIYPNRAYHLSQPLVILIDNGTSCSSEIFISILRFIQRAVSIGCSRTTGEFKFSIRFTLPSRICYNVDFYGNNYSLPGVGVIENKGIEPDIYVKMNKIEDLFPYEDKVLRVATEYLKHYK